jgi:hypothetical protein
MMYGNDGLQRKPIRLFAELIAIIIFDKHEPAVHQSFKQRKYRPARNAIQAPLFKLI